MAAGSIRERGGRFYVRTRVQVIAPETGEVRWKQVEKAAGSSKRQAQRVLRDLQVDADDGLYVPAALTVLEASRRIRSLYSAVNRRRFACATSSGSGGPPRRDAPGDSSVALAYGSLHSRIADTIVLHLQHRPVLRSRPQDSVIA